MNQPRRGIKLRTVAHARSGDKGSGANIAVFARRESDYAALRDQLTAERVEAFFKPMGVGKVVRFEVPNLHALNFILPDVLGGGGSRSLRIDPQGKALGEAILEMTLEIKEAAT